MRQSRSTGASKPAPQRKKIKQNKLELLFANQLVTLKRNPQYLTPKQMDSLKASINRDGFCVPVLVRKLRSGKYEIISGNHRYMAARELGIQKIPCMIAKLGERDSKRLAINLNTIHGDPNAELLAPFLADMDEALLADIHIDETMKNDLMDFDEHLRDVLSRLEPPDAINTDSPQFTNKKCCCPNCGRIHFEKE